MIHWNLNFLFFHVIPNGYHEKKQKNLSIVISKKHNASLLVSKNETFIRVSIMFFETPTLHISKIMPLSFGIITNILYQKITSNITLHLDV
jgi:hypothetical protein